jgi:chemotaxis protein methyltransferase CheR
VADRLAEPLVAQVAAFLGERTGLDFSGARGRWLRDFLASDRRDNASWCTRLLAGDDEAFATLCELATVQESFFFREPTTLDFIRETVLPDLAARPGEIRVWSAGCADGQEAYTLAVLLADAGLVGRARVLGTDLSRAAVDNAREAVFGRWSLRGVATATVGRCFLPAGKGFALDPRAHAPVEFEQHNLLSAAPPTRVPFDLVLCRNVLIYLTPEAVRRAGTLLASSLRPGGWLVTGVSDPSLDEVDGLEPVGTPQGTAYRRLDPSARPERQAAGAPSRPAVRPTRTSPTRTAPTRTTRRTRPDKASASSRKVSSSWIDDAERALHSADPSAAERLARAALASDEDRQTAYSVLVRALAADARLGEALEVVRHAVAELPVAAELRGLQSVVLLECERTEEAREAARQALYLDPRSTLAHLTLARASALLGDSAGARRARRNGQRLIDGGVRP